MSGQRHEKKHDRLKIKGGRENVMYSPPLFVSVNGSSQLTMGIVCFGVIFETRSTRRNELEI